MRAKDDAEKFVKFNVSVPPDLNDFIEREIKKGYGRNRSAVVQAALRAFQEAVEKERKK